MSQIRTKIVLVITVYWVLLSYIVAALLWWFIALNRQNNEMSALRHKLANVGKLQTSASNTAIEAARQRKTKQYIGEGVTFLAFITFGAVFLFRSIRKEYLSTVQQNNFMMAITHELKTPIAIARLNLETIQKRKLEPAIKDKLIASTLEEANRLNLLCENILLASHLDAKGKPFQLVQVDLSRLVSTSIDDFIKNYVDRAFSMKVNKDIFIMGEPVQLRILLSNLIMNAIKYSPKASPISIFLSLIDNCVELSVADIGVGIADSEKEVIFNRFYRSGHESTRTTKGTGMGLYLCKKIAKLHHAKITVEDNTPKGSIFKVKFNI